MKARLVTSQAERSRRIETGEQVVVGVNRFTESETSPLEGEGLILRVDPAVEAEMVADVRRMEGVAIVGRRSPGAGRPSGQRRGPAPT